MLVALLALVGCVRTATVEPAQPAGPALVLDVANGSSEERLAGYDWEGLAGAGSGEGTVLGCERAVMTFGEVGGTFSAHIDGGTVFEGNVPSNARAGRFLVVRIAIAADGSVTVAPPTLLARIPEPPSGPIAGCG